MSADPKGAVHFLLLHTKQWSKGFTRAANVEIFTSSLSHYTSLEQLNLCDTILAPAVVPKWTSLQSLQSLRLVDVASSPNTTFDFSFVSQLTNLTMLALASSQEQQMGNIFAQVSHLPNLQALAVTCFQAEQFSAVAALLTLEALTVEFCNDRAELLALQTLVGFSGVCQLQLEARKPVRAVNFGQEAFDAWEVTEGLLLHLYMTTRNEEAAMKAVTKMTDVTDVMICDISEPCSLRYLVGFPSDSWLLLVCAVGNEHLQQVSRIRSL